MKRTLAFLIAGCCLLSSLWAFDGFDLLDSAPTPSLSLGGTAYSSLTLFADDGSWDWEHSVTLELESDGFSAALGFSAIPNEPASVRRLSVSAFGSGYRLDIGLLTKEWGSGDGVHVVDVPNVFDYRNGLADDLEAMKVPEPMVLLTFFREDTTLELLFKPVFTPMQISSEGRWSLVPKAFGDALLTYPRTDGWSHGQFGLRVKSVLGPIDGALIYFDGYYPQPGYGEIVLDLSDPQEPTVAEATVVYTRARLFAGEATAIWGPLSLMGEAGFWLSEDAGGTDPQKYNSKWVYLAGIGMTIPSTTAYLSFTYSGQTIAGYDGVGADGSDVDGSADRHGNTLTLAFDLPFSRDRGLLRIAGTYLAESHGYALLPSVRWELDDNVSLIAKGRLYGDFGSSGPGLFGTWDANDSVTLQMSCLF